ncbi:zinc metalloprotease HtpX [Bacillus haynesii]|uniref:zinc metalloprotease HtpX n=1 Tax=Bacillus haynesii TaxID=1925021 RepID=UPI0003EDA67D|nr:zinc metalloprotease HtpX [Bacillus haynesii]EWH22680.1 peptidase M48 [Bacillus haynesii]
MEVRKSKFNYAYLGWAMLTVLISIYILQSIFSAGYITTALYIIIIFSFVFFMNYGWLGDWRNRIRLGLRRPATSYEKNYLSEINYEVYTGVQRQYPKLKKAEIFLVNDDTVNAFALGFKTIGLTTAAISSLTKEELKAVIAHEYAHLANKDTLYLILFNTSFTILSIGLFPFYIIGFFIAIILGVVEGLLGSSDTSMSSGLVKLFFKTINWFYLQYYRTGFYIVNFGSRDFEYRADEIAAKAGYADGLLSFFYKIEQENADARKGFLALLASTHPYTSYRIENIEKFMSAASEDTSIS